MNDAGSSAGGASGAGPTREGGIDAPEAYTLPFDPASPLVASGNLRRREIVSAIARGGAVVAAFAAVGVLGVMLWAVVSNGAGAISWNFVTGTPDEGGIGPALVGTVIVVALATAMAMPLGVLTAIYTTEFAGDRFGRVVRTALDMMNGLPTILIGIFIYAAFVISHHQNGFAAAMALAIIELPMIARTTQEVLALVPRALREGAEALGVARWRVIVGVIMPTVTGGILTATVLAAARVAGETAPQILVNLISPPEYVLNPFADHAMPTIPVTIFQLSEAADPTGFQRAWGSALCLMTLILIANIFARTLYNRNQKKNESR
ncbi:MAG: phosphate ABC transporter permease PstA [Thermoleophilaceae bacterium]|nr:phosphate ABC transporter permease PstA [Thermoleophilaceae bacterium]